ncbi:hexokinase family protein [Rutstroemia sp. NJR-2017a BBW]|nr:hexokinase family protein [Rutstroemia sp. NJR-2017a BBW]
MATVPTSLKEFLEPLDVNVDTVHALARRLYETYKTLARESENQFLATPLSEEVLRPEREGKGRFLAIDMWESGGSNLRAGFIELDGGKSGVTRLLEKSWLINNEHKNDNADDLFAWIGKCIAEVVQDGIDQWGSELPETLAMGVTFSFPMIQNTLSEAILMSMGKGFNITKNLNLGQQLLKGYAASTISKPHLPKLEIAAIVNDAVATLISFAYQFRHSPHQKAAMGLIVGTGCNATIPLALSKLHPSKRPERTLKPYDPKYKHNDTKLTINTEWSINGTGPPLHELKLVTKWDTILDTECEAPGFMPFEQMTSGRYLGELGRLIILDYFTTQLHMPIDSLPIQLRERNGLDATILATVGRGPQLCEPLETVLSFPPSSPYKWTPELAEVLVHVAKKIQVRAAGLTAAAIVGLLACADEIHLSSAPSSSRLPQDAVKELLVGYTGSCIVGFQDYLVDCQRFLDDIMNKEFMGSESNGSDVKRGRAHMNMKKIILEPCHDGGIIGAGILAGTVVTMKTENVKTNGLD